MTRWSWGGPLSARAWFRAPVDVPDLETLATAVWECRLIVVDYSGGAATDPTLSCFLVRHQTCCMTVLPVVEQET
jgi:hypothetical protein